MLLIGKTGPCTALIPIAQAAQLMHEPIYEVRDAVHGFVKLTGAEWEIVDCPTFQRLRDIRQLPVAYMVYPGANHTRFEHSLGCVHVSSQMLDLLEERQGRKGRPTFKDAFGADKEAVERGRRILRLAALLHDVGHTPFSHAGESLLPSEQFEGKQRRLNHEHMTARLIRESEIGERIKKHYGRHGITREHVIAVAAKPELAQGTEHKDDWTIFLNRILTGELGADRIDYLLRDAYHSGQPSGNFDYAKLLNALTLVRQIDAKGYAAGLDEDGWLLAEQMVVARYLMYITLYFHKTIRIYEIHLKRFLRPWLRDKQGGEHWPLETNAYGRLTDSAVLSDVILAARDKDHRWHAEAKPFLARTHLRLAKELVLAENALKQQGRLVPDRKRFDKLWNHVRITLGRNLDLERDEPDHSATRIFSADSEILILRDGKPRYIEELSEIVRGMPSRIWRGRIYAPRGQEETVRTVCDQFLKEHALAEETNDGRSSR